MHELRAIRGAPIEDTVTSRSLIAWYEGFHVLLMPPAPRAANRLRTSPERRYMAAAQLPRRRRGLSSEIHHQPADAFPGIDEHRWTRSWTISRTF